MTIDPKDLEKVMNPEELKDYMSLMKKAMSGMIKDQEENAATREKYAKESKHPLECMDRDRYYRLDLHLKGKEAIAVIKLLEGLTK